MCILFLRIKAVESLRIRGLQNSSARTCESNKGVFSNLARTDGNSHIAGSEIWLIVNVEYRAFPEATFDTLPIETTITEQA